MRDPLRFQQNFFTFFWLLFKRSLNGNVFKNTVGLLKHSCRIVANLSIERHEQLFSTLSYHLKFSVDPSFSFKNKKALFEFLPLPRRNKLPEPFSDYFLTCIPKHIQPLLIDFN